jgi:peptidoglycan L-alanyl-D-glutamate endopeptidase CwlK
MASRDKSLLHLILLTAYDKAIVEYGSSYPNFPMPFCTCTYRSPEEQDRLYLQRPKITNARGLQSPHNYLPSLAFDLAFVTLTKKLDWNLINFKNFANIITSIEPLIEWGGSWKGGFVDNPHFQLKNWKGYIKNIKP